MRERITELRQQLYRGARAQRESDWGSVNMIAPACPMRPRKDSLLDYNPIVEGLLDKRPYAGATGVNIIEGTAVDAAKLLFNAEHANVQPHSVSQANQAVYQGLLEYGDRALAMEFSAGGHLTHGMRRNFSGRNFDFAFYGVDANGFLDYDDVARKAREHQPKIIISGASSYPRTIDFDTLGSIAEDNGAILMADVSHPAGLIAAKRFPQPFPACDAVTLTLDKTMLGPHGGIILTREEYKDRIDRSVHPGVQSSFPVQRVYEMADALLEAGTPEFTVFIDKLLGNMKVYEEVFSHLPGSMVTGGSDTNLMVVNTLDTFGLTGKDAETVLEDIGILTNRQVVPHDTMKPYVASGIRFGTTWLTARGFTEDDHKIVADIMVGTLRNPDDNRMQESSRRTLRELLTVEREGDIYYHV